MVLPILILTISTLFVAYKLFNRYRFNLPPGPKPRLFVGNLYDLKPVLVRCFTEWSQIYGPIFSVYFGSRLSVVVNSPELAKQVLKDNDQQLAYRNRTEVIKKISKNGMDLIWADYGPHYVKVRKLCTLELFSNKRIEALRPIREDEVTSMVESIYKDSVDPENEGKPLQLRKYLGMMAFLHITRLSFGKRFMDSNGIFDEQGTELKSILDDNIKLGAKRSFFEQIPGYSLFFKGNKDELDRQSRRTDNFTKIIMEEHASARKKSGNTKSHFVDAMLSLQKEYDIHEDTIIGLLWDMISAGMDTSSITIEWAMAEIIRNPHVQQKIQEELDRVIGTNRVMTEADIANLRYLQCVTKECLRMHPPTPLMLPHKANANVKIGGYDIPKGASVNVNAWAIGRDPTLWKNPLEFRPERFLEEDIDMKGTDFRLIPFGSGRRVCPGAQLAINLVTSSLGHMFHGFTWTPPPGVKPEDMDMLEQPGAVTYMRTPLEAIPTPRLAPELYRRVAVGNV